MEYGIIIFTGCVIAVGLILRGNMMLIGRGKSEEQAIQDLEDKAGDWGIKENDIKRIDK